MSFSGLRALGWVGLGWDKVMGEWVVGVGWLRMRGIIVNSRCVVTFFSFLYFLLFVVFI